MHNLHTTVPRENLGRFSMNTFDVGGVGSEGSQWVHAWAPSQLPLCLIQARPHVHFVS